MKDGAVCDNEKGGAMDNDDANVVILEVAARLEDDPLRSSRNTSKCNDPEWKPMRPSIFGRRSLNHPFHSRLALNKNNAVKDDAIRHEAMAYLNMMIRNKIELSPWRREINVVIIQNKQTDQIILFLILLNCIFLAIEDPTDRTDSSPANQSAFYAEIVFTILFTFEMVLRIAGQGFYSSEAAYLQDPWNRLDFVIVLTGIASVVVELSSASDSAAVSCLRAFRLFKPLRAVTKVKEVQLIVNSLLQSLPQLIDVLLLFFMFLLIMGIVFVQQWKGSLVNTCTHIPSYPIQPMLDISRVCINGTSTVGTGHRCPYGYICMETGNPYNGKVSFDNILYALLTLFTVVTMEGWTEVMYTVFDADTNQWMAAFFFVVVVSFGSFFIVNLSLVIINNAFVLNVEQQQERAAKPVIGLQRLINSMQSSKHNVSAAVSNRWRKRAARIVTSKEFSLFITSIIVLNCFMLGIQHYGQPDEMTSLIDVSGKIFAGIYLVELCLNLAAVPITVFLRNGQSVLEALIVVSSLVDIIYDGVGVLNSLRLLRLFNLARKFPALWLFCAALANSVKSVAILTLLLVLVVFVYALLGMQLFGSHYCNLEVSSYPNLPDSKCPGLPRENFDGLGWALLSVFQVISGEDWNLAMHRGMRSTHDAACLYFITLFVIGNYVVLNLFIAVLLGGLEYSREVNEEDMESDLVSDLAFDTSSNLVVEMVVEEDRGPNSWLDMIIHNDRALFILPPDSIVRRLLRRLVENMYFEIVVTGFILVSTVSLAAYNPLAAPDEDLPAALETIGMVLAIIFLCEALLKITAYGFILHPDSYLRRDAWNILDFCIVVIGIVDMGLTLSGDSIKQLSVLRLFRTLRPLRFINKSKGLKVVVDSLINSIKGLSQIMVITAMIFIIFGIMGMQLFLGKFHSCSMFKWGDVSRGEVCQSNETIPCQTPMTKEACLAADPRYRWESYPSNFDNLGKSLVTLFEIATLEGWIEAMHVGIDANSDGAPRLNSNPWVAVYYILFIVLGAFFLVNLFVGVLIAEYESAGHSQSNLRWEQTEYNLVMRLLTDNTKPFSKGKQMPAWRLWLHLFVTNRHFEIAISACIAVNVFALCFVRAGQSKEWDEALNALSIVFISVFSLEAALKLVAFGPADYYADKWNRFDFIIVVISVLGLIVTATVSWTPIISILRVLRLARLLRVARMTKGVRMLLRTLFLSLPHLVNVAALLALLFSLYAILGVRIFGKVARGSYIHHHANFESFFSAVLLLFRVCTGEAWDGIMRDCSAQEPYCDEQLGSCGSVAWAYIYFLSFIVFAMFILLNLIVAIILREFTTATEEEAALITADNIADFAYAWEQVDQARTAFLPIPDILPFLGVVGPPLGSQDNLTTKNYQTAMRLAPLLQAYDGRIYYKELLHAAVITLLADDAKVDVTDIYLPQGEQEKMFKKWSALFPEIPSDVCVTNDVSANLAAVRLQSIWRGFVVRKNIFCV